VPLHSLASPQATDRLPPPPAAVGLLQAEAAMDEWVRQAEVWVRQAESWIRQQPPEQIYIAAVVVALTILLLILGTCAAAAKRPCVRQGTAWGGIPGETFSPA